jgi:hypothetical protein
MSQITYLDPIGLSRFQSSNQKILTVWFLAGEIDSQEIYYIPVEIREIIQRLFCRSALADYIVDESLLRRLDWSAPVSGVKTNVLAWNYYCGRRTIRCREYCWDFAVIVTYILEGKMETHVRVPRERTTQPANRDITPTYLIEHNYILLRWEADNIQNTTIRARTQALVDSCHT